nr:MAG TPA: hypothetical protein [Caudoviricetes sp.]
MKNKKSKEKNFKELRADKEKIKEKITKELIDSFNTHFKDYPYEKRLEMFEYLMLHRKEFLIYEEIIEGLRAEGEKTVNAIIYLINAAHDEDTKEEKNKIIESRLVEPRRMNGVLVDTSLGFIELDEEHSIPVINEEKLKLRVREIYEKKIKELSNNEKY